MGKSLVFWQAFVYTKGSLFQEEMSTKRTYQPRKVRRQKRFGFRAHIKTKAGLRVLKRRRLKGRKRLTA